MTQSAKTDKDRFDSEPAMQSTSAARLSMSEDKKGLIMQAWSELVKGRNEEALTDFSRASELDGGSLEAQYGIAATFKAMGRGTEAIAAYHKVLESIAHTTDEAERVRRHMLQHLAESALQDLETHGGKPAGYTPPR